MEGVNFNKVYKEALAALDPDAAQGKINKQALMQWWFNSPYAAEASHKLQVTNIWVHMRSKVTQMCHHAILSVC